MIFVIRGHIRNSFETKCLYNFIKNICDSYPDVKIFIHTWSKFANNISWRKINENNTEVTREIIYNYFDDLKTHIEDIIIDDDTKIELIGNIHGNINNGLMPIIGWKNYWYGKYKIIEHMYNKNINADKMIVNIRFDILNNSNSLSETDLIHFIKQNSEVKFTKNMFIYNEEKYGIDNIYVGNIATMYKLIHHFFYELDNILHMNPNAFHQEFLVYKINNILFT